MQTDRVPTDAVEMQVNDAISRIVAQMGVPSMRVPRERGPRAVHYRVAGEVVGHINGQRVVDAVADSKVQATKLRLNVAMMWLTTSG